MKRPIERRLRAKSLYRRPHINPARLDILMCNYDDDLGTIEQLTALPVNVSGRNGCVLDPMELLAEQNFP